MLPPKFYERHIEQLNQALDAMTAAKAMGNTVTYNIARAEAEVMSEFIANAKARNYEAIPPMARINTPLTKIDTQGT